MKTRMSACAGILLGFLANTAYAINPVDYSGKLYVEGKGGASWADIKDIKAQPLNGTTAVTMRKKTGGEDARWMYGGAIGYEFGTTGLPVRIETEYLRRHAYKYNSNPVFVGRTESLRSDITNQTVLGNLFIDIPILDSFLVFIGGGMGVAWNRTHTSYVDGGTTTKNSTDRVAYSWMGSAGFGVQPADWIAITLSYRFSDLGDVRWSVYQSGVQFNSGSFRASEALLGFRLSMPRSWRGMVAPQQGSGNAPAYQSSSNAAEAQRRQQAYGNIYQDK